MNTFMQDMFVWSLDVHFTNHSILMALQERRADRKKQAEASKDDLYWQQTESVEEKTWDKFWYEHSPELLLYACLHGTVEIVKYFVSNHVSPTTRLDNGNTCLQYFTDAL